MNRWSELRRRKWRRGCHGAREFPGFGRSRPSRRGARRRQWVAPGGFAFSFVGWSAVNDSGIMELRRSGDGRAEVQVSITEDLRNDMVWRWKALGSHQSKPGFRRIHVFAICGGRRSRWIQMRSAPFSWTQRALADGERLSAMRTSEVAIREGITWKELWVLEDALIHWHGRVKRKLVPGGTDKATAVEFANHGAGRSSQWARLARGVEEYEFCRECAVVALHIAGSGNAAAGAQYRVSIKASGGDSYPGRELRPKFRVMLAGRCGSMAVDVTSGDRGLGAWCDRIRSPARSAFEGPWPSGQLRLFPRVDFIDMASGRIRRSIREDWSGTHVCLLPAQSSKGWLPKLSGLTRVPQGSAGSDMFSDRSGGFRVVSPTKRM